MLFHKIEKDMFFIRKKYMILLLLMILVSNVVILFPILNNKYIYVFKGWGYDTYHQFIPELKLVFQKLKDGTSFFSFQDGLGTDLISIQRWVTDPFTLIIVLIALCVGDINLIEKLMFLLPMLVSIASGEAIAAYLRRYIRNDFSLLIASFMYALCGYLYTTGTHYWFASYLFYFPFLLFSIDKYLYENKVGIYIFSIAVVCIHGVYGAFPMVFVAIFYYFCLIVSKHGFQKALFKHILKTLLYFFIGFGMSMVVVLPSIYEIISVSGRVDNEGILEKIVSSFSVISSKEAVSAFLRLFSINFQGSVDQWNGSGPWFSCFPFFFSVLFCVLIPQWIYNLQNKRIEFVVGTISVIIILITEFVPMLFNMFAYNEWRMIYVILPFFALVCAYTIENLTKGKYLRWLNITWITFCSLMLWWLYDAGIIIDEYVLIRTIIFLVSFGLCIELISKSHRKMLGVIGKVLLITLLMTNIITEYTYSLYDKSTMIAYNDQNQYYHDAFLEKSIDWINEHEKDNFIRVDRTYLGSSADACWSYVLPARSLSMYNSLLDANIKQYFDKIVNSHNAAGMDIEYIYGIGDYGDFFDTIRCSTLGLKYIVSNEQRDPVGWKRIISEDDFSLYQNTEMCSGGLYYNRYIAESEYEKLSALEKQQVESNAVIVEDKDLLSFSGFINGINNDTNTQVVNLFDISTENCKCEKGNGRVFITENHNGQMRISTKKYPIREYDRTILSFIDHGNSHYNCFSINKFDEKSLLFTSHEDNLVTIILPTDCEVILIELGDDENIKLEQLEMTYIHSDFNNQIYLSNENRENIVKGNSSLKEKEILFVPIPYRSGWKCYVDEIEISVFKTNYGFMSVIMPPGDHEIRFEYHNKIIGIGIVISIIATFTCFVLIFFRQIASKSIKRK